MQISFFSTRMCNVTAWRHSRVETARSLANDPSGRGAEGEFPGNCNVSYLFFVYGSTGRVCGRSLTAGKILFTGRQTCSFYLVLWLCDSSPYLFMSRNIRRKTEFGHTGYNPVAVILKCKPINKIILIP